MPLCFCMAAFFVEKKFPITSVQMFRCTKQYGNMGVAGSLRLCTTHTGEEGQDEAEESQGISCEEGHRRWERADPPRAGSHSPSA